MATDFSSLDKLVEFGLGMGIATQMMNTMNNTLAQTAYPGVGINPGTNPTPEVNPAASNPVPKSFYIVKDEHMAGPLDEQELKELVKKGIVVSRTLCWGPGMKAWTFAEDIPEINKLLLLNS